MKDDWVARGQGRHTLVVLMSGLFILWYVLSRRFTTEYAIVLLGICIAALASTLLALGLRGAWLDGYLSRWSQKRHDTVKELATSLTPEEGWPREELIGLLARTPKGMPLKADVRKTLTPVEVSKAEGLWAWWLEVSELLVKVGVVCREQSKPELEDAVRLRYAQVRQIIHLYLNARLASRFFCLLAFVAAFLSLTGLMAWIDGANRQNYLEWIVPVAMVVIGILLASLIYFAAQPGIRWITEKTWTDLDDSLLGIVTGPLCAATVVAFVYAGISRLPSQFTALVYRTIAGFRASGPWYIISLLIVSWVAMRILDYAILRGVKRWAQRTKQEYDDLFVRMLQLVGSLVLVGVVGIVILVQLEPAFAIVASIIAAILGLATKAISENFLGGILLQVEKPFDPGDRILLPGGQCCDVIEIGMRSTKLYSVEDNSLICMPNSIFCNQGITNLSRPTLASRIEVSLSVRNEPGTIEKAETHLLDLAYCCAEADRARLRGGGELTEEHEMWGHTPLDDELEKLAKMYPDIQKDRVRRLSVWVSPYEEITENLKRLVELRTEIRRLRPTPDPPQKDRHRAKRLRLLKEQNEVFRLISERTYTIADLHPDIRAEMYPVFTELHREPSVSAEFSEAKGEAGYVKLTLNVFATRTQRSAEVRYTLVRDMQKRFAEVFGPEARVESLDGAEAGAVA
jgi:small-conductance mechanosensitive channel